MNSFAMLSRFFVAAIVIFAGSLNAGEVPGVVKVSVKDAGMVAAGYFLWKNGQCAWKELKEGDENIQEALTAVATTGAAVYLSGHPACFAAGMTVFVGARMLNCAKGTSVAHTAHNVLGDRLTSRPAQIAGLAIAGFGASSLCAKYSAR
jgi:hypothetical protein